MPWQYMTEPLAGHYHIIEPLSQGGFGQTFLARDHHLPGQPLCVIKQLKPFYQDAQTLETAKRLFDLEAETLYRLGNHDQIPRLLAHFEQAGEFYLVQDYIEGPSLETDIEDHPFTEAAAFSLLQDLLTVLAFVHDQGVIHRDIKPANLLRRQADDKIVLIDFGAVKNLRKPVNPFTVAIGSSGYMAPEQQASRPCFASDLYATGIVALTALTGLPPKDFQLPTHAEITCQGLGLSLTPPLAQFIDTLVHSDHRHRYPTAQTALAHLPNRTATIVNPATTIPHNFTLPPHSAEAAPGQAQGRASGRSSGQPQGIAPAGPGLADNGIPGQPQGIAPTVYQNPLSPSLPLSPSPPLSQQSFRNRQALLNKVKRFWIQGVLENSLHGQVLLTLGMEERPGAIAPPWNITWATDGQPTRLLPEDTSIIDIFDQIGEGRTLLILGEPGSGKTTTMLLLARELLLRTEQNIRIPVVFNLSSWQGESIADWLIAELNSKYQVPKSVGQIWVNEQQLSLLLDGLDEVQQQRRSDCIVALNMFYQDYAPEMVVCSRLQDYEALPEKLNFQSALYLRPLSEPQIWRYVNRVNSGLTGLKTLFENEAQLQDNATSLLSLARSPLMLNIMVLAYQGISPDEIPRLNRTQDYRKQLFDAYIDRMFQRRLIQKSSYSKQQTIDWLHHLSKRLSQTSQTVFMIERLQPDWLADGLPQWGYRLGVWLSFFIIAAAIGAQVMVWDRLLLALLIGSVICSRIFGVSHITPAETLRWSWRKARNNLLLGLTVGPAIGWLLKVGFGSIFGSAKCVVLGPCLAEFSIIGLAFGAVLGLTFGLIRGLSGTRVATASWPNQGIWQSARNAVLFALVATVTLAIPGGLIGNTKATFWAASGLAFGFAAGGGEAVVKHGVLRLMLYFSGKTPWNYARFLDYAAERIFLQKVGGGYIFVHRLLLEHFAAIDGQP
ncbi:MAG: protein kinase [Cyanobacteria bacterium P01_A01_bin.114]